MKVRRFTGWAARPLALRSALALVLALAAAWCAADAADGATISGVVRDSDGKPLEGAHMTLNSDQPGGQTAQTISGKDGTYSFTQVQPGAYRIAAELSGFNAEAPRVLQVSTGPAPIEADITLTRVAPAADAPAGPPRPKFEAAGVRGLIDPGGYSAPANAAAATGLISGVADIRRTENVSTSLAAADFPCSLEPDLKKAVEAHPQKAAGFRRLGEFYLAHRQATEAIQYLVRARQLDAADVATAKDLAEALMVGGQFDAAGELLMKLSAAKTDAGIHRLLARAEEGSSEFAKASGEYGLAAALEPSEENFFGVGYELILAGSPAEAGKAFAVGLERFPKSATLLIGAGTAEFLLGHASAAVQSFLQASDLAPSDPRPYAFLAGVPGLSGDQGDRVLAALKRYAELVPNSADASYDYALGLSHESAPDATLIEALLERAVALDPSLANAHFQLGSLYARQDNYERAAQELEAALRLTPDMKEAHYRLAVAYKKTGRPEQSAREMQLFSEAKESQAKSADGGISVDQFISVVDKPGQSKPGQPNSPAGQAAPCPVSAR